MGNNESNMAATADILTPAVVTRWMKGNLIYDDCREPQYTQLAELAADHFDRNGWLDDPLHFVWDCAINAYPEGK